MKKVVTIIATVLFAGGIHAASNAEVYHGWAFGNPDLSTDVSTSVGSELSLVSYDASVYNGFEQGNSELSFESKSVAAQLANQPGIGDSMDRSTVSTSSIYHGFEIGNPDL